MTHAQASAIPDSQIRTTLFSMAFWDGDIGEWLQASEDDSRYYFFNGNDLFVSPLCLDILSLATDGRMTAQRIWRMGTFQGDMTSVSCHCYSFRGIEYYKPRFPLDPRQDLPEATPGYSMDFYSSAQIMAELEYLGDIELIRQAILRTGKLWLWMPPS